MTGCREAHLIAKGAQADAAIPEGTKQGLRKTVTSPSDRVRHTVRFMIETAFAR